MTTKAQGRNIRVFAYWAATLTKQKYRMFARAFGLAGLALSFVASPAFASATIPGDASTVNQSSNCSATATVGWHFLLPDGGDNPRSTFVSITAVFAHAGTLTYVGPFTHGATQTPADGTGFTTASNDTMLTATAQADGADIGDFFVLSGIVCKSSPTSGATQSPSPSPSSGSAGESATPTSGSVLAVTTASGLAETALPDTGTGPALLPAVLTSMAGVAVLLCVRLLMRN